MIRILSALVLAVASLAAQAAVDVNKASQADLETVKGIGPGLSGKILDARKTGEFRSWNDLVERVGGIGAGNAARFSQAGLTVAGAAYTGDAAAAKPTKSTLKADAPAKVKKPEPAAKAEKAR